MTRLGIVTGLTFEAAVLRRAAGSAAASVRCGGLGRVAARAAAEALIADGATALLSFGIAGGLDPRLAPGTVVIGSEVRGEGLSAITCNGAWVERLRKNFGGSQGAIVAHTAAVITSANEKAHVFAATGAAAADMESYGAGEAAAAHKLPFAVVRVIADGANDDIPEAALRAAAPDGSIRMAAAIMDALMHPAQIRGLIGLGRRTAVAKRRLQALADFGVARSFFASV